jgi:ATP-dependent Lhr-like helicase
VLSLTTAHSFELDEVRHYLKAASVREVLVQALLAAPMFATRWRWVAGVALALPRFQGGRKVAPQLARMAAEDLMVAVFPDQVACAENLEGPIEIPDHPLVNQAILDCLHDAMDIEGLERLLAGIESGAIQVVGRDLTEPSPLALEVLSARPYAYLDDAPLEERRTQAVMARRWLAPETASDLGKLDAEAVARVRGEAWPDAANADELHDALVWLGCLSEAEAEGGPGWAAWLADLAREKRAARLALPNPAAPTGRTIWIAAERLPQFRALFPRAPLDPAIAAPPAQARTSWTADDALVEILRGRLEGLGPVSQADLAAPLGFEPADIAAAIAALEAEGFAMRGRFTPGANDDEWCERRLLARIHGYTVKRLRAEIEPVSARDFMRFLLGWQRVTPESRMQGPDALEAVIGQLEGFEAAAGAWESEILPARLEEYEPSWLDDLAGRVAWARLRPREAKPNATPPRANERGVQPVRTTPIALLARRNAGHWTALSAPTEAAQPGPRAEAVAEVIRAHGASFFDELVEGSRLLRTQVEEALAELVALGLVQSDSFTGLRALLTPSDRRRPMAFGARRRRRTVEFGMEDAGRWALTRRAVPTVPGSLAKPEGVEHAARSLLQRYGVVFWRLIEREAAWLPPWRELLRVYRRLEARGEIRGGRFVAGFTGEQFALPHAIGLLREARRRQPKGELVSLSGADPLNLVGIVTPGPRLAALTGNRVLYRDGLPIALLAGGVTQMLETLEGAAEEWEVRKALLRGAVAVRVEIDRSN